MPFVTFIPRFPRARPPAARLRSAPRGAARGSTAAARRRALGRRRRDAVAGDGSGGAGAAAVPPKRGAGAATGGEIQRVLVGGSSWVFGCYLPDCSYFGSGGQILHG